ncbi:hypothetical protein D0C16_10525 [Cellvibrio sp. KY-GH-1]|nr:hypothetical protein D0C16_10525 [Cellvibrio sp. KY-GH-1]
MRHFNEKQSIFGVFLQLQRRAKRQFLSCEFVEYFCVAKPQKRDLKTVQRTECAVLQRFVRHIAIKVK